MLEYPVKSRHRRVLLLGAGNLPMQPSPGVSPMPCGCPLGQFENTGGLLQCESSKVPKLDEISFSFVFGCKFDQGSVQCDQIIRRCLNGEFYIVEANSSLTTAMFESLFSACILN